MAVPMLFAVRRVLKSRAFRIFLLRVGPAVAAQAVGLARHGQWRQLAILHADSLLDGQFSREMLDDASIHWVVWQHGRPVAAYPEYPGPLGPALHGHDPAIRRRPEDLPTRKARSASSQRARSARGRVRSVLRRNDH